MKNFPAIMRIENETKLPIVFFPETLDQYNGIVCYAHIGQHSAASYEYFLKGTKPINKYNPLTEEQTTAMIDLVNEVCGIYETGSNDAVKIVWKKRISRK